MSPVAGIATTVPTKLPENPNDAKWDLSEIGAHFAQTACIHG